MNGGQDRTCTEQLTQWNKILHKLIPGQPFYGDPLSFSPEPITGHHPVHIFTADISLKPLLHFNLYQFPQISPFLLDLQAVQFLCVLHAPPISTSLI
jgi:hypothetical protein